MLLLEQVPATDEDYADEWGERRVFRRAGVSKGYSPNFFTEGPEEEVWLV